MPKDVDSMISDLVGTLTDPIIVYPGGWGETLPAWLKNAITLERLAGNMRGEQATGTDAEACAYLSTASLTGPMGYDWSRILTRYCGLRHCRYRGLDRAGMHTLLATTVCNIKRMVKLLWGKPDGYYLESPAAG